MARVGTQKCQLLSYDLLRVLDTDDEQMLVNAAGQSRIVGSIRVG